MKQKYLEVAKRMKEYEDMKYDQWREITEESLPLLLKKTLLAKVHPSGAIIQSNLETSEQVLCKTYLVSGFLFFLGEGQILCF